MKRLPIVGGSAAMLRRISGGVPPVVICTWDDASMSGHWQDGALPPETGPDDLMVHSVGWLVALNDHHLKLVQSITEGQHGNELTIPLGMVRQIKPLEF